MRISDWSSDVCSSDLRGGDIQAEDAETNELNLVAGEAKHSGYLSRQGQAGTRNDKQRKISPDVPGKAQYVSDQATQGARCVVLIRFGIGFLAADRKSTRLNSSH